MSGLLHRLREATRDAHAALDGSVQLDTPPAYIRFVQASLSAVQLLEPEVARLVPALVRVERVPAALEDLAELGCAPRPPQPLAHRPTTTWAALGAAYVLEGSTLGGVVLAKRVEQLGITATRYLRLRGDGTAARWRQFLAALGDADAIATDDDRDAACAYAVAAFQHYTQAFHRD